MKKKLFLTAILTLLCCTLLIAGASADLEGTGTADDPYEIGTAQDIIAFASKVNGDDNDACAVLTDNIDLNGNENNQWTPIGGSPTYKGTFDGKGHTISGLYYSGSGDYVGLFGAIGSGGTVTDVVAKDSDAFKPGEVAWLLNQGQTDGPWRQDLNTDTYPVLDSTHKQVVKLTVDGDASYHNSPYVFEGETGKAYFEGETRIKLPYTVTTDTTLTSKVLVTITADDLAIYVGDDFPDGLPYTYTISQNVELNFFVTMFCIYSVEKPGEYPILIDGDEVQGDYAFDYVFGKLTVLQSWIVTVDGEVYYVHPGESFTLPDAPSRPGYIFMGWRSGDMTYLPGDEVGLYGDTTFTSVWANMPDMTPTEPVEPDEPDEPDEPTQPTQPTEVPFADVSEGAWYYDAVKVVFDAGLMKGVSDTDFNPNGTLNRAMVWTMLARVDGAATDGGATWYSVAQAWAVENGVSDGADAMGALTREQLVTMLWRLNGEPVVNYLITTPDANQISSWALEAMRWAASIGLIEGDETGCLNPTATCTRAQAATFLVRYLTTE